MYHYGVGLRQEVTTALSSLVQSNLGIMQINPLVVYLVHVKNWPEQGISKLVAGVNTGRHDGYHKMMAHGFLTEIQW